MNIALGNALLCGVMAGMVMLAGCREKPIAKAAAICVSVTAVGRDQLEDAAVAALSAQSKWKVFADHKEARPCRPTAWVSVQAIETQHLYIVAASINWPDRSRYPIAVVMAGNRPHQVMPAAIEALIDVANAPDGARKDYRRGSNI